MSGQPADGLSVPEPNHPLRAIEDTQAFYPLQHPEHRFLPVAERDFHDSAQFGVEWASVASGAP